MAIETSYTSLRENLANVLDRVGLDQEVVIVHRRGSPDVALIPTDELAGLMETAHQLRSPANAKAPARGPATERSAVMLHVRICAGVSGDWHPYRDPERRFKPGMDGGLTAAILVTPPLYLRTDEILSKQWGPPQGDRINFGRGVGFATLPLRVTTVHPGICLGFSNKCALLGFNPVPTSEGI